MEEVKHDENPVVESGFLTARETFLCELGYDLWRKSLDKLEASLVRILTLDTTLLGGSLILLKDDVSPIWARFLAFLCFLLSLGASLYGAQTKNEESLGIVVDPDHPYTVEQAFNAVIVIRRRWLWRASILLWLGLAFAAIGVIWKGLS